MPDKVFIEAVRFAELRHRTEKKDSAVISYGVKTTIDETSGSILSEVCSEWNGLRERAYLDILRLQEDGVREALMRLGWQPPGTTTDDLIAEVCASRDRVEGLRKVLNAVAKQFRTYEDSHFQKANYEKAQTTRKFAEMCEKALIEL